MSQTHILELELCVCWFGCWVVWTSMNAGVKGAVPMILAVAKSRSFLGEARQGAQRVKGEVLVSPREGGGRGELWLSLGLWESQEGESWAPSLGQQAQPGQKGWAAQNPAGCRHRRGSQGSQGAGARAWCVALFGHGHPLA